MIFDLKGKVAFITGAAHGQGRATALALAKEGVHIAAFDIARQLEYPSYKLGSEDDLTTLKKEVEALGVQCIACKGDVRSDVDVTDAVTSAKKQFGSIDILFNNAGVCAYGFAHELTEQEWDSMLDINLKGAWMVARRIIPFMIEQRSGVIINNSSVAGLRGMNRLSHYAASKWGLNGLSYSVAEELRQYNIRVTVVCPGSTASELSPHGGKDPRKMLQPTDIAHAVEMIVTQEPQSFVSEVVIRPTQKP